MKRKKRRSDYKGCSLSNHKGKVRFEWRVPGQTKRATWRTRDAYTPENCARWEPVRQHVVDLCKLGVDPIPHLKKLSPAASSEVRKKSAHGLTVRTFFTDWIATQEGAVRPALS